eukprot:5018214-Prymnesium_polylepis.1
MSHHATPPLCTIHIPAPPCDHCKRGCFQPPHPSLPAITASAGTIDSRPAINLTPGDRTWHPRTDTARFRIARAWGFSRPPSFAGLPD